MAGVFRGLDYWEIVNNPRSPRVSRSFDRSSATRTIDVNWADAEQFAYEALGYPLLLSDDTVGQYISRVVPWPFPSRNRRPSMFCTSFEYEGLGLPEDSTQYENLRISDSNARISFQDDAYLSRYKLARCTLQYTTPTYEVLTDEMMTGFLTNQVPDESRWLRYVTKVVKPQGEFLSISGTNSAYYAAKLQNGSSQAVPVSMNFNKIIAACNYSVTWHQVPAAAVPMQEYNPSTRARINGSDVANTNVNWAIDNCLGRVNDREFNGIHQWTLLLLGVEIKPIRDAYGQRLYDITYMFKKFEPDVAKATAETTYTEIRDGLNQAGGLDKYTGPTVLVPSQVEYPGHNHVFLPATKLTGVTVVGGSAAEPGWYEVLSNSSKAIQPPFSNWAAKAKGVNIYDSANFANLFRPVTWSRE